MKPKHRKWVWIVLAILLTIIAIALWRASTTPAPPPPTAAVTMGDLSQTVLAVGRLRAKELVAVGAQVSGQVKRLHATLGQQVKEGDLIAEVDAQPQQIALRSAEASVNSLRAQLKARRAALVQASLAFERQQTLLNNGSTPRADYEAAQAALDTAHAEVGSLQAQIEQARTQVETARTNLGYTRIVAPMDGVVVAVVTKEGQTLNSFQTTPTIVMLAKLDVMTVRAEIAEADVNKVKPGQTAWFTTLGNGQQRHVATIESIEPAPESIVNDAGGSSALGASQAAAPKAIYYNALFDVPNPDGHLRPSMTAQVSVLVAEAKQTLLVPNAALGARDAQGTYAVRVLDDQQQVVTRQVQIGLRTNATAQVLSGLQVGEQVVIGDAVTDGTAAAGSR